jgi:hypothetical protein
MPATSIRDLVVHHDDLVVGTHGRSFWILDDITPLRQIDAEVAAAEAFLFKPQTAYRVRWNVNTDTPLPPEEPRGENPPDGAIINYHLRSDAAGPVTLEVFDQTNKLVRRYSNADKPEPVEKELNVPTYWIRPPQVLSIRGGMHRFVWDLHYPPPEGLPRSYPISAVYRDTASAPAGPWVLPGQYTIKLTVSGHTLTQPLTVKMDPRVKTPLEGLTQQFAISLQCWEQIQQLQGTLAQIRSLRTQLKERRERAGAGALAGAIASLEKKVQALAGQPLRRRGEETERRAGSGEKTLTRLMSECATLLGVIDGVDATPTSQAVEASRQLARTQDGLQARWAELKNVDVAALNEQLKQGNLPAVNP